MYIFKSGIIETNIEILTQMDHHICLCGLDVIRVYRVLV